MYNKINRNKYSNNYSFFNNPNKIIIEETYLTEGALSKILGVGGALALASGFGMGDLDATGSAEQFAHATKNFASDVGHNAIKVGHRAFELLPDNVQHVAKEITNGPGNAHTTHTSLSDILHKTAHNTNTNLTNLSNDISSFFHKITSGLDTNGTNHNGNIDTNTTIDTNGTNHNGINHNGTNHNGAAETNSTNTKNYNLEKIIDKFDKDLNNSDQNGTAETNNTIETNTTKTNNTKFDHNGTIFDGNFHGPNTSYKMT